MLKFQNKYYSLILNRAHYNVSMMFLEDNRRDQANDNIDIVEGIASSYANLFMLIDKGQESAFLTALANLKDHKSVDNFINEFGIKRMNKNFWEIYSDFSQATYLKLTNESGALDLNRYIIN